MFAISSLFYPDTFNVLIIRLTVSTLYDVERSDSLETGSSFVVTDDLVCYYYLHLRIPLLVPLLNLPTISSSFYPIGVWIFSYEVFRF